MANIGIFHGNGFPKRIGEQTSAFVGSEAYKEVTVLVASLPPHSELYPTSLAFSKKFSGNNKPSIPPSTPSWSYRLDTPWGYTQIRTGGEARHGSILFRPRAISEPKQ